MNNTISVVGLGKLGACMAAAFASRGVNVIGVDINQMAVAHVNAGHAPVQEPQLDEVIAVHRARLRATTSHREAIHASDLTFVIVPTPSDEQGAFSLREAVAAFQEVGRALADKSAYHTVVLTSTVLPGATRYGLLPILERVSGKRCGREFGLCYSPAFIALGSAIRDFLHPDFTLIGEFDERAGNQLADCYAKVMQNNPPCQRMSIENAELAKIALNAYVTTKITFANMLVGLCERIPGGDIDVVTNALGMDSRIGRKYLTGALGYGGPCFPRDNRAVGFIAKALETDAALSESTDRANRLIPAQVLERLGGVLKHGMTVAVLGIAYKPCSHVIEDSQGIDLAKALFRAGMRVLVYDPLARDMARQELQGQAEVLDTMQECLAQAEAVFVATPDVMFQDLSDNDFNPTHPVIVIDCWRILDKKVGHTPRVRYRAVGRSDDHAANAARLSALWSATSRRGET